MNSERAGHPGAFPSTELRPVVAAPLSAPIQRPEELALHMKHVDAHTTQVPAYPVILKMSFHMRQDKLLHCPRALCPHRHQALLECIELLSHPSALSLASQGCLACASVYFPVMQKAQKVERARLSVAVPLAQHRRQCAKAVSYTHLRAHETRHDLVCRL